jgi:triosephosphate isomerase
MKYIIGNWKMNGNTANKKSLFMAISKVKTKKRVIICPPFTLLTGENYGVKIGAQDISQHENGAYTGDISGQMLKDCGAKYVIVGHSERRIKHGETNQIVKAKSEMAIKYGIIPIICVGENANEKKSNKTTTVVKKMLLESIPDNGKYIIAYEPVWAIGTGKTPTTQEISNVIGTIFNSLPESKTILYGGSVNKDNAHDIMSIPNIDGLLIGGASLKKETFIPIIKAID